MGERADTTGFLPSGRVRTFGFIQGVRRMSGKE